MTGRMTEKTASSPSSSPTYLENLHHGSKVVLALGVIRLRTRGILWPYLAHVCADTAIAVIAVAMLR